MTAVEIAGYGGPEVLRPVSLPVPEPGEGQILIAIDHAGVKPPRRRLQRAGNYAPAAGRLAPCRGWKPRAMSPPWAPGVTRLARGAMR